MAKIQRGIFRNIWNLPNVLTMFRVFMIPFVLWLIYLSEFYPGNPEDSVAATLEESKTYCWWAFLLFSLAAITDFFDGYLARRAKLVTMFGKFLDPLADKLIVMAALVGLVELGRVPSWIVILILLRELSINGLRALAMAEGLTINVINAGKWKTAFQLFGIGCLIIHYTYPLPLLPGADTLDFHLLGLFFLVVSLVFSLGSAASYIRMMVKAVEQKNREATEPQESCED
jgi:CDP-diacylglycerol--glycerol-3-phosphate 3-phosphatidyltransferase